MMKGLFVIFCLTIVFTQCRVKNDIDSFISQQLSNCTNHQNCTIDFSEISWIEWDTMYYYSASFSLEEINEDIGFSLSEFTDIGDRVIFLKNRKVVYHHEWFDNPSKPLEGIVFKTDERKFKIDKLHSKFRTSKDGEIFCLEKME